MKLALRTAVLLSALFLFTSCSQDGDVKIVNNCNTNFTGILDEEPISLEPGESYSRNIYIGKKAFLIGPDEYDIELSGSAWTKKPFKATITVKAGETTTFSIKDDIGALRFLNDDSKARVEFRIQQCTETEYSESYVNEYKPIKPGKFLLLQLDEGCYDVSLRYGRMAIPDTVSDLTIEIGSVTEHRWSIEETSSSE